MPPSHRHHRESLSASKSCSHVADSLPAIAGETQIAALLVALHMKGETVEEIEFCRGDPRGYSLNHPQIQLWMSVHRTRRARRYLRHRWRCSGTSIFLPHSVVVAGAGRTRRKHGNRSVTVEMRLRGRNGVSGREDRPACRADCRLFEEVGIAFSFLLLPCTRDETVQSTRRDLRLRTISIS